MRYLVVEGCASPEGFGAALHDRCDRSHDARGAKSTEKRTKPRRPSDPMSVTCDASPSTGIFGLWVERINWLPGSRAETARTSVSTTYALSR